MSSPGAGCGYREKVGKDRRAKISGDSGWLRAVLMVSVRSRSPESRVSMHNHFTLAGSIWTPLGEYLENQ